MDYCTLDTIDAETMQTARNKTAERIAHYRRKAASLRLLADKLDGKYITARVLPEIKTILANDHVYLSKDGEVVSACYGSCQNMDTINLYIKERRADGAAMKKDADGFEATADTLEKALDDMDYLVHEYNAIAANYAAIHGELCNLFEYIPDADYHLQLVCDRATYTPDEFAALIS